jgi:hypothetical protein
VTGRLPKVALAAGALVVLLSVGTSLMMLLYTIGHERELAEIRGDLASAREVRAMITSYERWMVAVYSCGSANGWKLPPPPIKEKSDVDFNQKAPVRSTRPEDRRVR